MKTLSSVLVALLVAGYASASPGFYVEAGGGHASFSAAEVPADAPRLFSRLAFPAIYSWSGKLISEQKSKNIPVLAAGYRFNDRFGVRLSYQSVRNITTETAWEAFYVGAPPVGITLAQPSFYTTFEDDLHVISLAPELTLPLVKKLNLVLSPELNWVALRRDVHERYEMFAPPQHLTYSQSEDKFTLGASVGVLLELTEKLQLSVRYKYVNVSPSFGRDAHETFASLRWSL